MKHHGNRKRDWLNNTLFNNNNNNNNHNKVQFNSFLY